VEIDIPALEKMAKRKREIRECVTEYTLPGGKRINLLAEGRLVNLSAAEGHPASVMDMSFANQALSAEYLVNHGKGLENRVYNVPERIDSEIARLKLNSMGVTIDRLTPEQKEYLAGWEMGT
jgi:adenosylhomocysteinase